MLRVMITFFIKNKSILLGVINVCIKFGWAKLNFINNKINKTVNHSDIGWRMQIEFLKYHTVNGTEMQTQQYAHGKSNYELQIPSLKEI